MLYYFHKHFFFLALLFNIVLFIFLLAQNPFSSQNSLSDLYPYPDSIHYINPAMSSIQGYGFRITREGRAQLAQVPLLYSATLVPFYLISNDPRMFYFANVSLALTSAYIFFLILKLLIKEKILIVFTLFLYVTDFCIFWYPKLAMAENLGLTLMLLGILLLLKPVTRLNLALAGALGVGIVATKYAWVILALSFYFLFFLKIIAKRKKLLPSLSIFFVTVFFSLALFLFSEHIFKNWNLPSYGLSLIKPIGQVSSNVKSNLRSTPFSESYFSDAWAQYLAALIGGKINFARFYKELVPPLVGFIGFFSLFVGLLFPKKINVSLLLLILLLPQTIFLSYFKIVDGRYILFSIPILMIGFCFFLEEVKNYLLVKTTFPIFLCILLSLVTYLLVFSLGDISKQLKENIHGDGGALNYQTVLNYNNFFSKPKADRKPVIITSLTPYFVDLYSNKNYELAPLSNTAYFADQYQAVWGSGNYDNLSSLYESYLKDRDLYVSDFGIYYWNTKYLLDNFNKLEENYQLILVSKGCGQNCNLYKITHKLPH